MAPRYVDSNMVGLRRVFGLDGTFVAAVIAGDEDSYSGHDVLPVLILLMANDKARLSAGSLATSSMVARSFAISVCILAWIFGLSVLTLISYCCILDSYI